ncbi:vacuolar fusion protein mon1 [Xylona heveae TC161]|uniref:Vacuolar fusion protein MON1 n=1 Tax=Xylona heveae (strain CBS 132557 / TC161) TaxID=1328760 RepID=A0A165I4E3_XYLHT|nr:vacuolar fusion protein mon1 [Xylona heveae TC161]KZF24365.1 vacuolar fusion protein mon1 [Xylona heveae TC161]
MEESKESQKESGQAGNGQPSPESSKPRTPEQEARIPGNGGNGSSGTNVEGREEAQDNALVAETISRTVHSKDSSEIDRESSAETPPPLPPRPVNLESTDAQNTLHLSGKQARPKLQSHPTTAVSLTDISTQVNNEGIRETYPSTTGGLTSPLSVASQFNNRFGSPKSSETEDTASIKSYVPTLETGGDVESLLGEVLGNGQQDPAWRFMTAQGENQNAADELLPEDAAFEKDFQKEFKELEAINAEGTNEEAVLDAWTSRMKHFLILSAAGKPIYSRHGDDNITSGYIGIIQTIISFYQNADDTLKSFTAGDVKFVVLSKTSLYLVAISRLGESDGQLRAQLEALYMQILSTLTLPRLQTIFSNRPSSDLRRPLSGTEPLLSALADTFTRGSPPTLLSALECLRLRKSHRQVIDQTLLKTRTENLLYGLIVAGGRLVSVVRPKKHSLHPSDLQLIFNMLFETEGVKTAGGENWIPLCLPGFNNTGFLYMYVSFLSAKEDENEDESQRPSTSSSFNKEEEVAVLLISPKKESFYEMQQMRDDVVEQLQKNGSMDLIKAAVRRGRPHVTDVVPGTVLRHFLYKSKANVQFAMPSFEPHFKGLVARRKLLSIYHTLHANVHSKISHLKVHYCVSRDSISLAWTTPLFELYCVAGPSASRGALAQSANKVVQWARKEEERIFIIGGAVF